MKACTRAVITIAAVFASAAAASADPITIIQDGRATNALADPFNGGHAETAPPSDTMRSVATLAAGTRSGASTGTLSSSYAADPLRWFGAGAADVSFTTPGHGQLLRGLPFHSPFRSQLAGQLQLQ